MVPPEDLIKEKLNKLKEKKNECKIEIKMSNEILSHENNFFSEIKRFQILSDDRRTSIHAGIINCDHRSVKK